MTLRRRSLIGTIIGGAAAALIVPKLELPNKTLALPNPNTKYFLPPETGWVVSPVTSYPTSVWDNPFSPPPMTTYRVRGIYADFGRYYYYRCLSAPIFIKSYDGKDIAKAYIKDAVVSSLSDSAIEVEVELISYDKPIDFDVTKEFIGIIPYQCDRATELAESTNFNNGHPYTQYSGGNRRYYRQRVTL